MTDLVQRLRHEAAHVKAFPSSRWAPHRHKLLTEAADEIERWRKNYSYVLEQSRTRSQAMSRMEREIEELHDQPKIKRLEVADLQPGDVLIANAPNDADLTDRDLASIRETLEGEFPGHQVIVLCGIELRLVRPEGGAGD